jgi:hypothetical protein
MGQTDSEQDAISSLDEMLNASLVYRNSKEYLKMLEFITRFRKYAPFNCFLMHIQRPGVSHVATAKYWREEFERKPKSGARPMVILAPMHPILFVFDVSDTEGKPLPEEIEKPFAIEGHISTQIYLNTIHNSAVHGIEIIEQEFGANQAGYARRLTKNDGDFNQPLNECLNFYCSNCGKNKLEAKKTYVICLNKNHSREEKYATLVHELAHVFCGHTGIDTESWWHDRRSLDKITEEFEAESVSYLVCLRKDLNSNSEKYLSGYVAKNNVIPDISMDTVLKVSTYIEKMAVTLWKKPNKTSLKKKT